jgi:hypothetical protein
MLTGNQIIAQALRIAKAPNYTVDAQNTLNTILSDVCQADDLALARGLFSFNFNPGLVGAFGSGPYALPLDYLRASGSSGQSQKAFFWTLNGTPYPMRPCDLSEFDMQVQVANQQSFPWLWATDMGGPLTQRLTAITTASLTAGSVTGTVLSATGITNGLSMAGEGVTPGTTVTIVGTTITMSQPATGTNATASVFFGIAPGAFAYPPPVAATPVTIRYQRMMPPIQDFSQVPWLPAEGFLIDELAGRMMEITDDSRVSEFIGDHNQSGRAGRRWQQYLDQVDDNRNRPQLVELDSRRFGSSWRGLRTTKQIGW